MRKKYFSLVTFLCLFSFIREAAPQSVFTDKARYAPGESVQFTLEMSDSDIGGSLAISYFHLNAKIENEVIEANSTAVIWSWQPPPDDYKGYLADIIWQKNGAAQDTVSIAIDVSSDWAKFPRYGFLSEYPRLSQASIEQNIAALNRFHINGLQFYDWHFKHHLPLKGTPEKPASSWQDIANRTNYFPTVAGYIEAAHKRTMMTMSYNLLYGAYRDAANDGVSTTWRLFKDPNHHQPDKHPLPSSWASDIYLVDPSHPQWIDHILNATAEAFAALDFDGWHIDQLGDRGTLYNYNGEIVNLPETYAPFILKTKQTLDTRLVMNAVNQFGQPEIATAPVDFLYTEVWPPNDSYSSLVSIIQKNNSWSDGKLATVLAAYVNKAKSGLPGTFNTPAVLLTDAVIFAAGGAHVELGEHMLGNEYFPNDNLSMTDELQRQLISYYDFLVAYQNLLRDGGILSSDFLQSESALSIRNVARKGSVWSFSRHWEHRSVFHLINFTNAETMNWRDDDQVQPEPAVLKNIPVSFTTKKNVAALWLASPDIDNSSTLPLSFSQEQEVVSFTIPSLKYWDMIVVEFESASSIETTSAAQVLSFGLTNAPNPFNPKTQIHFFVHKKSHITVDIYNILGRHIDRLADRQFERGSHSVQWRPAADRSGGVYMVIVRDASGLEARRKLLYVK